MAKKAGARSPGSLLLEIIVALLVVVLLLTILYPRKQWREQARNRELCRDRMENLYFAARFYHRANNGFTSDIGELLEFARAESITVHPPGFKMDRLTREDSGVDSFQVDYYDPYQLFSHYERAIDIEFPDGRNDTLVLTIKPLPRYDFAPVTRYTFASDVPITAVNDDRGEQGIYAMVGAQGRLRGAQILGEPVRVPAADYIYSMEPDELGECPSTGTPYRLWVNVKMSILGEIRAVLEKEPTEHSLAASQLHASNMVYRLLKEANAQAKRTLLAQKRFEAVEDSLLKSVTTTFLDSTAAVLRSGGQEQLAAAIYDSTLEGNPLGDPALEARWEAIRDSSYTLVNATKDDSTFQALRDNVVDAEMEALTERNFTARLEKMRREKVYSITETGVVYTTADSAGYYSAPELIKGRLFKERTDSVTRSHLERADVRELQANFSFTENYRVGTVDSVGVLIKCPIEGEFRNRDASLLERIFTVSGETNHGAVKNGDLSWSEKK